MALHQIKRDVKARERRTIQKKMGDTKDESQKTADNNGNGSNKTLIILGMVVGIVLIAMLAVVIVLLLRPRNDQTTAPGTQKSVQEEKKRDVLVTESNVEELIEEIDNDNYVPPGYHSNTELYLAFSDWIGSIDRRSCTESSRKYK